MKQLGNFLKTLWFRFILWLKPPKLGQVEVAPDTQSAIVQSVKQEQQTLDVIETDWDKTIEMAFDKNNGIDEVIDGIHYKAPTPVKPDRDILHEQIHRFYKDYSRVVKRQNETFIPYSKYDQD